MQRHNKPYTLVLSCLVYQKLFQVPGQGPRGMRTVPVMGNGGIANGGSTAENGHAANGKERVTLTGYEMLREGGSGEEERGEGKPEGKQEQTTPNVKKRHRWVLIIIIKLRIFITCTMYIVHIRIY